MGVIKCMEFGLPEAAWGIYMKRWNTVLGKVVLCVCEIIVGVLLMADPIVFTSGIITAAGVVLLMMDSFTFGIIFSHSAIFFSVSHTASVFLLT